MAIAGKNVISKNSDEKSFISDIYDYILALNVQGASITCDTTIADQFDVAEVTTPTFNFTITPNIVLRMERPAEKTTSVQSYLFKAVINDEVNAQATINFASSALGLNDVSTRKFFIGYAVETLNSFIWIGAYTVTDIVNTGFAICSVSDSSNFRYGAGNNAASLENSTYYRSAQSGVEYSIANLFNYASEPGYIEYITHVSFINSNQEQARSEELVNCSEISQGRSVAIQGGDIYFSVGPHTLIALD